jgi:hypothetical protein
MILYNWARIVRESNGSGFKLLDIVRYITYKPRIKDYHDKNYYYSTVDWRGQSFLIHPERLFKNRKYFSDRHIIQYIGLAGLRNYTEYKVFKKETLDLLACKGKEDLINNNSLLHLEDENIHFLFEEATTYEEGLTLWD